MAKEIIPSGLEIGEPLAASVNSVSFTRLAVNRWLARSRSARKLRGALLRPGRRAVLSTTGPTMVNLVVNAPLQYFTVNGVYTRSAERTDATSRAADAHRAMV